MAQSDQGNNRTGGENKERKLKYDYLVVGSGIFGATFAQQAKEKGKNVLVIDKRDHIAGNVYTKNVNGINAHQYGCHIFHTDKKDVWDYVNRFVSFNNYRHKGMVNFKGKMLSFPINLMTMSQLWGVRTPEEARKRVEEEKLPCENPKNMEEWCLSVIGRTLYETFIEGYSTKQWEKHPRELSASIVKRLPVRYTFNDDYFHDLTYQGIPIGGYTKMVENMLDGVDVELGTDFESVRNKWKEYAKKLVFCGGIDSYFEYQHGELEYRSLKWDHKEMKGDFQGHSCVNYTDLETPWTRIIEHKHFENPEAENTIISREYSVDWRETKDPYYPINDERNTSLYRKYRDLAENEKNVIISGRLGSYKYLDMDDTISMALKMTEKELS
jgi:UDP-galactopyranose mutase